MIIVERFVNELMSSNCYIAWNDKSRKCIVIDPGSEKAQSEITFIDSHSLVVDYIILTHEHTDHTWGCNALLDRYNPKIICSEKCKKKLAEAGNTYFRLYYEREDYTYTVKRVDKTTESLSHKLYWEGNDIRFISTPGHSMGSICIQLGNILFTGDTLMMYKPYINKRDGDKKLYEESVAKIITSFSDNTTIYPGHGDSFSLKRYKNYILGN